MELTGKCKRGFQEWALKKGFYLYGYGSKLSIRSVVEDEVQFIYFHHLPLSMQFGVYQDYADSIGYIVNVYCNASGYLYEIHRNAKGGGTHLKDSGFEAETEHGAWYTMDEARKAAIKAFDDLVNGE